jgi:membrane protease YdiL (CAAX protease family)
VGGNRRIELIARDFPFMSKPMNPLHRPVPDDSISDALPADDLIDALPAESPPEVRRPFWPTLVAWLLITGVAAFIIVRTALYKSRAADALVEGIVNIQMQGRYLVGAASLGVPGADAKSMYKQALTLDHGSYSQRLRFAVLAGELAGPGEALKVLKQLEADRRSDKVEAREVSIEAAGKLERLYAGYRNQPDQPTLPPEDQQWLRSRLGWFGELALAPQGGDSAARAQALAPARRTVAVFISALVLGVLGLATGIFLIVLFVVLAWLGFLRGGLECGTGRGGIYAETFALYMLLFVGLSYLARFVPLPGRLHLLFSGLIAFASLLALFWPRLRGISWRQIRDDVGLHLDGRPWTQFLCGPACYLCALPLLLAGVLITYGLMLAQRYLGLGDPLRPGAGPSHPIMNEVLGSNLWVWLQVFLVACIAAPIVEEIMFRGVLYRHLREASCRWGRVLSILFSALASSFVFAAIHPQGWLGISVLMALAFAFALTREWRRSLLPAMIAHGINNGVGLLVLMLAAA